MLVHKHQQLCSAELGRGKYKTTWYKLVETHQQLCGAELRVKYKQHGTGWLINTSSCVGLNMG